MPIKNCVDDNSLMSKCKCVGKDGSELSMLCGLDGRDGGEGSYISSLLAALEGGYL